MPTGEVHDNTKSALLNQPDEILIRIVDYLHTDDLIACRQTCQQLRGLLYDKHFDRKLFRGGNVVRWKDPLDMQEFALHPLLRMTNMLNEEPHHCYVSDGKRRNRIRITNHPDRFQMATSPPMAKFAFSINRGRQQWVQKKTGITVIHLVTAVCRHLGSKVKDRRMLSEVRRDLFLPSRWSFRPEVDWTEDRKAKYIECLADTYEWDGFDVPRQYQGGYFVLRSA